MPVSANSAAKGDMVIGFDAGPGWKWGQRLGCVVPTFLWVQSIRVNWRCSLRGDTEEWDCRLKTEDWPQPSPATFLHMLSTERCELFLTFPAKRCKDFVIRVLVHVVLHVLQDLISSRSFFLVHAWVWIIDLESWHCISIVRTENCGQTPFGPTSSSKITLIIPD